MNSQQSVINTATLVLKLKKCIQVLAFINEAQGVVDENIVKLTKQLESANEGAEGETVLRLIVDYHISPCWLYKGIGQMFQFQSVTISAENVINNQVICKTADNFTQYNTGTIIP